MSWLTNSKALLRSKKTVPTSSLLHVHGFQTVVGNIKQSARLEDITGRASFSTRTLMSSRPVALFEGILLRSASTISLVTGGMQNLSCDEGGI